MPQATSHPPYDWQRLDTLIRADLATTQTLLTLLQREKTALETREYEGFDALLADKQRAVAELEQGAGERAALLAASDYHDDAALLAACTNAAPDTATCWRELIAHWEQCQHLNQVNEQIVRRTRLVIGRVLDILQGRSERVDLYDAGGQTRHSAGGRDISQA
ncbi:MAG: flagellar protein FlgN [Spongiibacteraceae bacterium]|jgi:flagella synthesis protein FlgN|nr:flagellar protein FlgN [Spongiibacteraceae bacterium]